MPKFGPNGSPGNAFDVGGSLAGLVMRSARKLDEAARPLLLITAQPLAHGGDGDLRQTAVGFMPC